MVSKCVRCKWHFALIPEWIYMQNMLTVNILNGLYIDQIGCFPIFLIISTTDKFTRKMFDKRLKNARKFFGWHWTFSNFQNKRCYFKLNFAEMNHYRSRLLTFAEYLWIFVFNKFVNEFSELLEFALGYIWFIRKSFAKPIKSYVRNESAEERLWFRRNEFQ